MNYSRIKKIERAMNEILHGDIDEVARKHIGLSADRMDRKQKDKALAEVYISLEGELKDAWEAPSDTQLRKEQIDDEMKNILSKDRDELLGARIRNYNPSMSVKDKDKLLAEAYDTLQKERDRLDKMSDEEETKNDYVIDNLPDKSVADKVEVTPLVYKRGAEKLPTLPYVPAMAEVKPLSNIQSLKYSSENRTSRGMTERDIEANLQEILNGDTDTFLENNAEMYGFSYDPDMSAAEKEDIIGCIYDTLEEERRKLKEAENKTQTETKEPDTPVNTEEPVASTGRSISEIEHNMNEILHGDFDYVIETYASQYGIEYDEGSYMNQQQKQHIVNEIYRAAEAEHADAMGFSVATPRPSSVITAE